MFFVQGQLCEVASIAPCIVEKPKLGKLGCYRTWEAIESPVEVSPNKKGQTQEADEEED